MSMTELGPLDHIVRGALPWRDVALTECGRTVDDVGPDRLITRAQLKTRIDQIGQQRAAFTTCMTCIETARRWSDDPIHNLHREIAEVYRLHQWMPDPRFGVRRSEKDYERYQRDKARHDLFVRELAAITALIAEHRDEFDGYLAGIGETASLDQARAAKRRRRPPTSATIHRLE
jgi:hypothetical protein